MPEGSDPTDPRHCLLEQFQTLADEIRGEEGQPRDIAARPRQAGDEPAPNRIGGSSEDNGEGPGRLLGSHGGECGWGQDDIDLEGNEFGRESGEPLELPLGISVFDQDVAALDVTELTQSLAEGLWQVGTSGQVDGRQPSYSSDLGRLLGLGGERCGEKAASQSADERSPRGHWMISSARCSKDWGIVSPRALAVLRLMTSSNLVGCSTGRSAAFAPLRSLST